MLRAVCKGERSPQARPATRLSYGADGPLCFGRCIGAHLGSGHGRRHLWTFLGDLKAKIKAKEGRNRPKKGCDCGT